MNLQDFFVASEVNIFKNFERATYMYLLQLHRAFGFIELLL